MAQYFVNKHAQSNGDHEVHKSGCSRMPDPENRIYLGEFETCEDAVISARKYYAVVDGCYYCAYICHTR